MADHTQDLVGKEGHNLTLPEGRGQELHKPTHAIREETLGKEGLKEEKELHKATLEEHRQAREDMPILPDTHNKNSPLPHHHEQHAQHHSAGEEHKP